MSLETVPAGAAALLLRPYKGLDFYTASEEDALFFVGRDTERKLIVSNQIASRLTILYGASGVGKSSLLNAGVAYQLRHDAELSERGTPEYAVVVFATWRDDAVTGLIDAVGREVAAALDGHDVGAVTHDGSLATALREWGALLDGELLIILDQFEEFFLYHGDETDDAGFAAQFAEAINDPAVHANFLVSIREDAFGKLDLLKERIPNLFENCLRLDHLGLEAGREAIERPLERWNELTGSDDPVTIGPGLVDEVLEQVRTVEIGGEGLGTVDLAAPVGARVRVEAPYLQLVLTRIWRAERELNSSVLRLETLRALGGAQKIVDARVEEAMGMLSPHEQAIAAGVCHYLVSRAGTKIAFGASDLADFAGLPENDVAAVLEKLTHQSARILRPMAPPAGQPEGTRYELFHDKLAKAILAWRAGFLERQAAVEAERRVKAEQDERQRESRNKLIRWAAVTLMFVVLALVALSLVALQQRSAARGARDDAQSRYFAARAIGETEIDPAAGVRLAASGLKIRATDEAEQAFRQALEASHLRAILRGGSQAVRAASFSLDSKRIVTASDDGTARVWDASSGASIAVLRGHTQLVLAASFSPDGTRVVTAGADGSGRVWDASSGRIIAVLGGSTGSPVLTASFSPDSEHILTVSAGSAHIWDASSGRNLGGLGRRTGSPVLTASYSPDGTRIVTTSDDGTAGLWDAATARRLAVLRGHTGRVWAASFSPDGKRIVTASADTTARVWDASTGRPLAILSGDTGALYAASFSPNGELLVTASDDGTARVWDASTGKSRAILIGDSGPVYAADFSPDGKLIVTASEDHTARVWDASSGKALAMLGGDTGPVYTAEFSADDKLIVTASADGTARVWNVSSTPLVATLPGLPNVLSAASLSPDRKLVVTASTDGKTRIWDVSTGKRLATLRGDTEQVLTAGFSRDGRRIVTASADGTTRLWDAASRERLNVAHTHATSVSAAAFSPDGKRVVTGSADGTARVWDATTGRRLAVLRAHNQLVVAASFSADGKRVVTASADGTARVWDASSGNAGAILSGPANNVSAGPFGAAGTSAPSVNDAAFSPDGKLIVTASADKTARVWDASSGQRLITLTGDTQSVSTARFSPDGKLIVTASADGTARVWDASSGRSLAILSGDAGPVLGASFSPDGELIVTANADGRARIYACRFCATRTELRALARFVSR